ncbi:transposase [Bdellovibrio sp. 22V]|uniref:transposase n=1 Tax=Bdellovibrio TaxID=958 RepID=UPI00254330DE|nr:transposase [Bdellovibrio sp. 22V]WII72204.1 transposase [Bdellovibrio sp. 22V]
MPRQKQIYTAEFPYHLSARSHNKEWFHLPIHEVWEIMSNYLYFIHQAYKVEIHAFVLMSNHFHLIARFPENNMQEAMNYFMRETSRVISRSSGRINQTYGSRYFRSVITKDLHLEHVYKYVYRNPVEAKICAQVEDYPFSTLQIRLGLRNGVIPLAPDLLLEEKPHSTLTWLNTKPLENDKETIRKSLKRPSFGFSNRSSGTFIHHLEVDRY